MGRRRFSGKDSGDEFPDDGSVDLAAVRRDDALIDAIAGNGPVETRSTEEFELATLLADWRADILAQPMPAGPDLEEVVAAVNRELGAREALASVPDLATRRARSKAQLRLIRPIAGAAALVAAAIGGAAVVSYGAEPGDPLWGVKQVVFSEQAESTEARIDATSTLQRAEELIAEGNTEDARELLTSAENRFTDVRNEGERDALGDWMARLTEEINKLVPPPPPAPGTGVPVEQGAEVPVPPIVPSGPEVPPPVSSTSPVDPTSPSSDPVDPTILDAPAPPGTTSPPSGDPSAPPEPSTPTPPPTTPAPEPTSETPPTTTTNTVSLPQPSSGTSSAQLPPASIDGTISPSP